MIIYKAKNKINGKVYIGQTIVSLNERKGDHRRKAERHGAKTYFHCAIRKYGFDSFEWDIIDSAKNIKELNEKEKYWIKFYNSLNTKNGYNIEHGGDNKIPVQSTRDKISKTQKGRTRSDEFKKKISNATKGNKNPFYGKHHSEESRRKCGLKNIGRRLSPEHIAKCIHIGENNYRAVLKEKQVVEIKTRLKNGERICHIAKSMNIRQELIKNIKYCESLLYSDLEKSNLFLL
jgi:group I intron endonuclease